jgi:salicylate hydroxylase
MRRAARIAVIGGGIGGLTAARALRQRGFEPRVYEVAPELKEIGAGVALHPNAMKALRSLELEGPVRAVAWESDYQLVRDGQSGRILSKTPLHNAATSSDVSARLAAPCTEPICSTCWPLPCPTARSNWEHAA